MRQDIKNIQYAPYLRRPINRVIHVGMHEGEELNAYVEHLNASEIISFEPNPLKQEIIHTKIKRLKSQYSCIFTHSNLALGSAPGVSKLTCFSGFSSGLSSLLEPDMHQILSHFGADQRHFSHDGGGIDLDQLTFDVVVSTLDEFLADYEPHMKTPVDLLVVDVQGYELEVLKGSIVTLNNTNAVYTEVTASPQKGIYKDIPEARSIKDFLVSFGFAPFAMSQPYGSSGHANMLFGRQ